MAKIKPIKAVDAYMGKTKKPKAEEFNLTIVGLKYRMADRELKHLEELIDEEGGVPAKLEREPTNEVDPKAVKVIALDPEHRMFYNVHIGYVRRPANGPLTDLLRRGATVKMAMLTYCNPKSGEAELQLAIIPPPE